MLVFGSKPETLPVSLQRDATTGLPLLREQDAILQTILAYLALPYSVTEYGCGKKASLIINQLLTLNIPPYAISRGMILERDMSPAALDETDYDKRAHALVADNPLYELGNTTDEKLRDMLARNCPDVQLVDKDCVKAGPFYLRHAPRVQFVTARSHIFTIVTFWDDEQGCAVERVIDPSLHRDEPFEVEQVRKLLHAPEGVMFQAPLLGHFHLDLPRLTDAQRKRLDELCAEDADLETLSWDEHASLVRRFTGAETGSLGDPDTWTYANNTPVGEDHRKSEKVHFEQQSHNTGLGDGFTGATQRLLKARRNHRDDASAILAELRDITENSNLRKIVKKDAQWSQKQLEPLADAAMIFVYYRSLGLLADIIHTGKDMLQHLQDARQLQAMRGIGVRLRRRIDWLGQAATKDNGCIDARTLNAGFAASTLQTIHQMNQAGLSVFIDRVGNIHGLLLDDESREAIKRGDTSPAHFTRSSIAHCSHIDTVNDAGKFDGRLGVLSGIETLHVLTDLQHYFGIPAIPERAAVHTHVSAFIGEEMTFTGQGISMPGSAAVSGCAEVQRIHRMRNGDGDYFIDHLTTMLREIKKHQLNGDIGLVNNLANAEDDALIDACSEPGEFYTPHTFERHIEQGPFLDRADVPLAMVDTIMGIHQEDVYFKGANAEAAALEMNRRLRNLTHEERFADVRVTVGILQGHGYSESIDKVYPALRWTFEGEPNHAGTTPMPDRRDPGVAAARLARAFLDWFDQKQIYDKKRMSGLRPVVSNIRLSPGSNRNVIPGSASMTVALTADDGNICEQVDDMLREDLTQTLKGYAVSTLARRVAGGGEGVQLCRVEPLSYTNIYREARLSIDLRSSQQAISDDFRTCMEGVMDEIRQEYAVQIHGELQQTLPPFKLKRSGQVLLIERSYGGGHNPRETELLSDIIRGCILQIAITREVLAYKNLDDLNLFRRVESHMPDEWLKKMPGFTSGAQYDTCNIAARAPDLKSD